MGSTDGLDAPLYCSCLSPYPYMLPTLKDAQTLGNSLQPDLQCMISPGDFDDADCVTVLEYLVDGEHG